MSGSNLEDLARLSTHKTLTNTTFVKPSLSGDTLKFLNLTYLPSGLIGGTLPNELRDFLKEYFNFLVNSNDSDVHCTEADIISSEFSCSLRFYLRCVEKLFFDYCLYKGLNFKNYEVIPEFFINKEFSSFNFNYEESMYNFYIIMFLDQSEPDVKVLYEPFLGASLPLANNVPFIFSHTSDSYFCVPEKIPAMIVKVKGV